MSPNKPIQSWFYSKKILLTMVALLLAVSVLSACGKKKEGEDAEASPAASSAASPAASAAATGNATDVIATYKDGGKITRGEFDAFINVNKMFSPQLAQFMSDPAFQQDMLKQMVTFRVVSAQADDKIKADADKQVADQMKSIQDYFGKMEGGMDKQLKDNNVELKDIESLMKMSFYTLGTMEAKVTDQQVQDSYNEQAAQHTFDIATVSHILISLKDAATQKDLRTKDEALARAKEVKDKLDKGGDFAALAKEYSDDPGSKDNGGTYKDADVNQWVPQFKEAAITLPLNKISDPVESDFGYHIMKVESRSTKPLDDTLKTQIKSQLAEKTLSDYAEKEIPGMIESNNLPQPTPAPAASPAADASPAASETPAAK
ncbi:peptidylprolyl isomerase [Paenibacillus hexagrammi]|uniref:Peptidylprolyl isomerase n=1 Tax=Paenibacillus hexagrammi TaxID=2908839 RepID=A0ABY3SHZ7_9BACL|nr:peptidylprolyl isomerase [Paenibacillus sp. YPD9-1]UJF33118.1 peptidylprolyl isomerase [Paenibacillus sp. YPD9-1]